MSVRKRDRAVSKLEFYKNAMKFQRQIISLLTRDFGMKSRIRETSFYTRKWDKEDAKIFTEILEKYDGVRIVDEYPLWMVEHVRKNILKHLDVLMANMTEAYTIFPRNSSEAEERRLCQDKAIAACENILHYPELAADIFPLKPEKLMPSVETCDYEIRLLKGWRKSGNKWEEARKSRESEPPSGKPAGDE